MEALLIKRRVLKGRVTRIETVAASQRDQPQTEVGLKLYLDKLEVLTKETDAWQEEIGNKCNEEEFEEHEIAYNELMERIETLHITFSNQLSNLNSSSEQVATTNNSTAEVRLPKLELPVFGGKYENWLPFRDMFTATVHSNASLSGAQKLQYLKSALRDEASLLIHSIALTDANYQEAWDILMGRYNNTREIIDAHIKRLFEQPAVKQESATALRRLIDTTAECLRALKVLNEPVQHWDTLLLYVIKGKLDPESHRQWELSLKTKEIPSFEHLTEFLEQRARALAASQPGEKQHSRTIDNSANHLRTRSHVERISAVHHGATHNRCPVCDGDHAFFKCSIFLQKNVDERRGIVRNKSLCFNCLQMDHKAHDCKLGLCRKCNQKHNTLLHREAETQNPSSSTSAVVSHFTRRTGEQRQVLLSTAIVPIKDSMGQIQHVRALLDSASQASFISQRCAQRLQLKRIKAHTAITGIGASGATSSSGYMQLYLIPNGELKGSIPVQALILPKVTRNLPSYECDPSNWTHIKGLSLADANFNVPSAVDLVLGADVYMELVRDGRRRGPPGTPDAFNTIFGWVLLGPTGNLSSEHPITVLHCTMDEDIKRFWELEDQPRGKHWTKEEEQCEKLFVETFSRDADGRYVVRLPFKEPRPEIGESREIAHRRFLQLERRFRSNAALEKEYDDFMEEYHSLGHMKPVVPQGCTTSKSDGYYMPHHAVIRESSSTTRLRVVFNASERTSIGTSLNDTLMVGPKVQDDLINLLIRFRLPLIVLTADLTKMYRQIHVHEEDTKFQRIIWKGDQGKPVQDFELLTVTYGTASAPYLATRVLQQLAEDEANAFPTASEVLARDFYVDDLLTGVDDPKEASKLRADLTALTQRGGFELRKWASNEPAVTDDIPATMREVGDSLLMDKNDLRKTLGLWWHPNSDEFSFRVHSPEAYMIISKRSILSEIARVFDPFGLLAPITVQAKILLQRLWQRQLEWDDQLPGDINAQWLSYRSELQQVKNIKVPRCVRQTSSGELSLHGFCDASEVAYAAVVYVRTTLASGESSMRLLAARTKVAPLKSTSLPRLELCGAILLVKLFQTINSSLKEDITEIHAWTDSTIVLAWISSNPGRWKTFVANRVAEIQGILPATQWHHIAGENNPADCASRGMKPSDLITHHLWWEGPSHLPTTDAQVPEVHSDACATEERNKPILVAHSQADATMLTKFSTLSKLKRVTAYIKRFIFNCRQSNPAERHAGPLTSHELNQALYHWVRTVQQVEFLAEVVALKRKNPLPAKSQLLSLCPFIDQEGLLRVGGRLGKANLTPDQVHPMLLPRRSRLTEMVIDCEHLRQLHGGQQLTLTSLQRKFWILGARNAVRFRLHKCLTCVRQRAATTHQLMGELPRNRVLPCRPFLNCGVDYAGPFLLRVIKGRGHKRFKAYVAVFVCFATRAMHLELVGDLTAEAFLATLKRFVSRRGRSANIYSDCGTNFVGAAKQLREFVKFTRSATRIDSVAGWLAEEGIVWHFNPPAAPHFGGLWEAGVKSVKHHLRRTMGDANLTYEEMQTLLCQVEACLNSRPLTQLSSDPSDFSALTPGHFLIGDALTAVPEPDFTTTPMNRLSRWQATQRMVQHFWKRWKAEYLSRLQQRPKWLSKQRNIQKNDLVLIKEDDLPPTKWKLGRVVDMHPGTDGCVRVVTLKTPQGLLTRPVVKLCLLPLE